MGIDVSCCNVDEPVSSGDDYATDDIVTRPENSLHRDLKLALEITPYKYIFSNVKVLDFVGTSKVRVISDYAFAHMQLLESIVFPQSLEEIRRFSFYDCPMLKTISFRSPSRLYGIGDSAFEYNSSLTSVQWPASLRKVGKRAFNGCVKLTQIRLKETSILEIGSLAFGDIPAELIELPKYLEVISESSFGNLSPGALIRTTIGSQTILTETNGLVHFIPAKAVCHFNRNKKTVIIRRGAQRILSSAFRYTKIVYITIPASVEVIGKYTFADCLSLVSIIFSKDSRLKVINEYAFKSCKKLGCIYLPPSLIELRSFAFQGCESLILVNFGLNSKLQVLGDSCFEGTKITTLDLPPDLKEINGHVCGKVQRMSSFTADNNPNFIVKDKIMLTTDGKEIVSIIPSGLKMEIPLGVKVVRTNSVSFCLFFQVEIPVFVEEIRDFGFNANEMLTKVTFSDGSRLQHIGKGLFKGSKIKNLSLPESVESIDIDAFVGLQLDTLEINNNKFVTDYEGVVHSMDPPGIIFVPNSIERITINPKCVAIYGNCFRMTRIKNIIIPPNVKTIGSYAFASSNIESITFKQGVQLEHVGRNAFYCSNLKSLDLPIGIETIEDYAFGDYPINIPANFKLGNHTQAEAFHGNTIRIHITALKEIASLQFKKCIVEIDEEVSQSNTQQV